MAKRRWLGKSDSSAERATPRVFVSYRRDDSSGYAGRLYADLSLQLGEDNVFIDIDSLIPGADFIDAIEETLAACDLVLVVIGRSWLAMTDANGKRRLDNTNDFVSMEVGEALERSIGVIPVLVGGAIMPDPEELPEKLVRLARRHAMELSDRRWPADVQELLLAIHKAKELGAVRKKDLDRIVRDSTTPRTEVVSIAQTAVVDTESAVPDPENSVRDPEVSVKEPSVAHATVPFAPNPTATDSLRSNSAPKPTELKESKSPPEWVSAIRHPSWRVVGGAVLVVAAAAFFVVRSLTGPSTVGSPSTVAAVKAECLANYDSLVNLHGTNVTADCQSVAKCYAQHMTGISAAQFKVAESHPAAIDKSETAAITAADSQCQKALPTLVELVEDTDPVGVNAVTSG